MEIFSCLLHFSYFSYKPPHLPIYHNFQSKDQKVCNISHSDVLRHCNFNNKSVRGLTIDVPSFGDCFKQ